jgi:LuxR family transcriptional regulator, maltose regulon positive regulatory protein
MIAWTVTPESPPVFTVRLQPPAGPARRIRRPRIEQTLAAALDYPLCSVTAPLGSGKTQALAGLARHGGWPTAWLRCAADDDGPRFAGHLIGALARVSTIDSTRIWAAAATAVGLIDTLANELAAGLNDETVLVIDDCHLLETQPAACLLLERLIVVQPLRLHIIFSGRWPLRLTQLAHAALRGEVLAIEADELAFDEGEARRLWAEAGYDPPADLAELITLSDGWPLALQSTLAQSNWRAALGLAGDATPLDSYLDQELFAGLPADLQHLLHHCAGLQQIDAELCAALIGPTAIEPLLDDLRRRRLITMRNDGTLRFPALIGAWLQRRAAADADWPAIHRRAADFYQQRGAYESALFHLLAIGDPTAVQVVGDMAEPLIAAGRAEDVLLWLRRLPVGVENQARVLELQGAALRRLARSEAGAAAYRRAEQIYAAEGDAGGQVRCLRGLAAICLDTVQPGPATDLLRRAVKLLPRREAQARAELIRMQAENWVNLGRADVALRLERAADQVAAGAREHRRRNEAINHRAPSARLLLRAGRLSEAQQRLEAQLRNQEGAREAATGAHREPALLLALIHALLGAAPKALALAGRVLFSAQQQPFPQTEALAALRLAHAYQLVSPDDHGQAQHYYAHGLQILQRSGVARTRAEGLLGLTLLHGHRGDLLQAEHAAREGLQLTESVGDAWTAALLYLALGSSAAAQRDNRADGWLSQAEQRFQRGGDGFGTALVTLWRLIAACAAGRDDAGLDEQISSLMRQLSDAGALGVLCGPSLFGPRDSARLVPILLRARRMEAYRDTAQRLLLEGFPSIAVDDSVDEYHPGFTLRIQMLGMFRVVRGNQEILAREWQREKARQLFQLLVTLRGNWIQREQICSWLWPDTELEAAERQFKVTLNALNSALEPHRPPRIAPFFIRRMGLAYSFAPSFGVWIDVDEFELRVAGAAAEQREFAQRNAQAALQLYRGDFLAEALYDPWTTEERERLLARYLTTATAHAARLSESGDQAGAIQISEQILRRDRCYEEAYQILMRAHARAGSRSQALRSFTRCREALSEDLAIEPLPETIALHERLRRNLPI